MATEQIIDQYVTYDARLASFYRNSKKRGSSVSGRGKALAWPHKQIAPASLAKAGFYFHPTSASSDNVNCFLCGKCLDGWEVGDDPLLEHLKHAPECGWAIVSAIEAEIEDYPNQDPRAPHMIEARHATFAGKWPHEGKKGWKCKTNQLVEAGWKYTPTAESDDMATCLRPGPFRLGLVRLHADLAESDEHYSRSPGCAFFLLVDRFECSKKKMTRGKTARASKASRPSAQSVVTTSSEALTAANTTTGDDSILTTTSNMSQGGRRTKVRKAVAARASRTRAKKSAPVENTSVEKQERVARARLHPVKATRGKKRDSGAVDDGSIVLLNVPATKRRTTRTRSSSMTTSTTVVADDSSMISAHGQIRLGASVKVSRQPSALLTVSTASIASLRGPPGELLDDEEIERQLEVDLANEWDSDDDGDAASRDADSRATNLERATIAQTSATYAMFDPSETHADDAAVEEELRALQAEMEVDEHEETLRVPKKTHKTAVRKVSKQAKPKKSKIQAPLFEEQPQSHHEIAEHSNDGDKDKFNNVDPRNTDALVSNVGQEQAEASKRSRVRPNKASFTSQQPADAERSQPLAKGSRGRSLKTSKTHRGSTDTANKVEVAEPAQTLEQPTKQDRGRLPKESSPTSRSLVGDDDGAAKGGCAGLFEHSRQVKEQRPADEAQTESKEATHAPEHDEAVRPAKKQTRPKIKISTEKDVDSLSELAARLLAGRPSTPSKVISPAPSAKQPALSPSQSPQSSDAENRHPSLQPPPPASTGPKRVALAPVTATSPAKRNVLAGLESSVPWTVISFNAVLGSLGPEAVIKENMAGHLLRKGSELTSPEKAMTVEEWIYFNAGEAERKMKHGCEAMVSMFEREGTRAMSALEGLMLE